MLRPPVEPNQYTSIAFTERLAEAGIQPSVGAAGSSYDNALAETVNGLYKTELIKTRGPWRSVDHDEFATAEWVDWFNYRRLYQYCGDAPPAEMEAAYYAQNPAQQLAGLYISRTQPSNWPGCTSVSLRNHRRDSRVDCGLVGLVQPVEISVTVFPPAGA